MNGTPRFLASIVLAFVVFAAGCANGNQRTDLSNVSEIGHGLIEGYLAQDALPSSLALIPPVPAAGSAELALDEEVSRLSLALQDTPRWDQATEDANLSFPDAAGAFECALGVPINPQDTPYLYMLLRRSLTDAGLSTYTAKTHYQRTRPFMANDAPICTPEQESLLRTDGSYPSGHTALGWAWALILSELAPELADEIVARGRTFGESRIICNVHWNSDVREGRFMGAATVALLHSDPTFLADLAAAREEITSARDRGLEPSRDCAAESQALSVPMLYGD